MARTFLEGLAGGLEKSIPLIVAARQRQKAEEDKKEAEAKRTAEALSELKARYPQLFEEFAASRATLKDSPIIPQEDPSGIPPLPMTQEQAAAAPQQTIPFDESTLGIGDIKGLMGRFARQREEAQYEKEKQYREDQAAKERERLAQKQLTSKFERALGNRSQTLSKAALYGLDAPLQSPSQMVKEALLAAGSLPLDQRESLTRDYEAGVADLGVQVDKSVFDQQKKREEEEAFRGAFANAEGRFSNMFKNKEGVSDDDIDTVRSALAKLYPNLSKSRISEAIESAADIVAPEFPIPKRSVNLKYLENIVTTREGLDLSKEHPNLSQYSAENKEAISLAASPSHMFSFKRYVSETGEVPDINEVLSGEIGRRFAIGQRRQLNEEQRKQEVQENIQFFQALKGEKPASPYISARVLEAKLKERYENSKEGEEKVKAYRAYINSSDTSNVFDTAKNEIPFTPPLDPKTGYPKWQFFKRPMVDPETREIVGYDVEVLEMPVEMGVLTREEKEEKDRQLKQFNQFLNSPFQKGKTRFVPLSPQILKSVGIPNANIEVQRQD